MYDAKPKSVSHWADIAPFAIISLVSFLCGALLLYVMLAKAEELVALGLVGNLYYVVLLPLGLAVSAFLFGVLRSYARYKGKVYGGVIELRGAIVGFALVVIGGFVFVENPTPFALTVFVHGEAGLHDVVLRNNGFVVLDLGPDRRREPIGDKGQAYFPSIPATFRGKEVRVWIDAKGYAAVNPDEKKRLESSSLYISARKKDGRIFGRVRDEEGTPIRDAVISIGNLSAKTDALGRFDLTIPGDRMRPEFVLDTIAPGFRPSQEYVVPNANEVTIVLRKGP